MSEDHSSELQEAIKLLKNFEKATDQSERIEYFEEAIDILDSLVDDFSTNIQLVTNLRLTYTRKLLEHLPSMEGVNIDDWVDYTKILLLKVNKEVDVITSKNEELKQKYKYFINIWVSEVIALLEKDR